MNTLATKQQKLISEQLLEAQALLQDLARILHREFRLLVEAQEMLRGDEELRLF